MANYILTIYINWLFNVWSWNKKGRSWQTTCPDFLLNGFESQAVWQAPHKHPWWTTYLHFKGTGLSRLVFTNVKQQAHKHRHFKRISRSIPDNFWLQNHTDFWDINQKYLFWNSLYKVWVMSGISGSLSIIKGVKTIVPSGRPAGCPLFGISRYTD